MGRKKTWSCIQRRRSWFWANCTLWTESVSFQKSNAKGRALTAPSCLLWASEADCCLSGCLTPVLHPGVTLTALLSQSSGRRGSHTGSIRPTGCRVTEPRQVTRENIKREVRSCQDVMKQGLGENQERAEWTLHLLNYQLLWMQVPRSHTGSRMSLIFHPLLLWRALWGHAQQGEPKNGTLNSHAARGLWALSPSGYGAGQPAHSDVQTLPPNY